MALIETNRTLYDTLTSDTGKACYVRLGWADQFARVSMVLTGFICVLCFNGETKRVKLDPMTEVYESV